MNLHSKDGTFLAAKGVPVCYCNVYIYRNSIYTWFQHQKSDKNISGFKLIEEGEKYKILIILEKITGYQNNLLMNHCPTAGILL